MVLIECFINIYVQAVCQSKTIATFVLKYIARAINNYIRNIIKLPPGIPTTSASITLISLDTRFGLGYSWPDLITIATYGLFEILLDNTLRRFLEILFRNPLRKRKILLSHSHSMHLFLSQYSVYCAYLLLCIRCSVI